MQRWLVDLRLTCLSRLWGTIVVLSTLVVFLSSILFGTVSAVMLCIAYGLVYTCMCYLCYQPDGSKWRRKLDSYYERLFIHVFSYVHSVTSPSQAVTQEQSPPVRTSTTKKETRNGAPTRKLLSETKAQPSKLCHREAQKIIQLIMRDFVHSWYGDVTGDLEFPDDAQKLLEHVALETNIRLQKINLEEIVTEIATLVIPYLEVVNETGMRKYNDIEIFDVNSEQCLRAFENNHDVAHRALSSRDLELKYYRQALDTLIQCAFPDKYQSCDIACTFVRELLLKNIIEPVFELLCDPDFLLKSIPVILKKATTEKVERELADIRRENEELERRLSHGRLILKIKGSPVSQRRRFQSLSGRFGGSEQQSISSSPEFKRISPRLLRQQRFSKQRPKTVAGVLSKRSTWAFTSDSFESPLSQCSAIPQMPPSHDPSLQLGVEPEASASDPTTGSTLYGISPPKSNSSNARWSLSNRSSTLTPSWKEKGLWEEEEEARRRSHSNEGDDSTWDLIEVPRGPIYFDRHVRVVSGSGNSSHTAYIFKFPKRLLCEDELMRLGVSEVDTHLEGMKRYSQFDKFHSSLVKTPLSVHLKGVSLPGKLGFSKFVSKLSLGGSDPDPVELQERVQGLEKYLQSISAIHSIADSPQFHEFLISGIESLKQANIVKPQAKAAARRKTFLGLRRGPSLPSFKEATQRAEPIPKRPVETVLSAYLDTHLPLPSNSLHTLHRIKTNTSKPTPSPTSSLHSPTNHRRGTIVSEPSPTKAPVDNDSPVSSLASVTSTDSRGVPFADLAATPKAGEFFSAIHESQKPRKRRTSSNSPLLTKAYSSTSDNDTEHSSVTGLTRSVSFNLPYDDEEGQTVGSTTSLSSLSFVSATDEGESIPPRTFKTGASTVDNPPQPASHGQETRSRFSRIKTQLSNFFSTVWYYLTLLYHVVLKGLNPVTPEAASSLAKEQQKRIPLTNALLSLSCVASSRHCPELWACHEKTQLAVLVLVGGGMERFMWKELKEVVNSEENWSRALYHLRHTLWPNGKFMKENSHKPTEVERKEMRNEAVTAIKKFLPNFLPIIVGPSDYDNAAHHVLDCLQNPKITRYFLLRIVDVFLVKLIPEISKKGFQKQLAGLRTMTPPPRNRFSVTGRPPT